MTDENSFVVEVTRRDGSGLMLDYRIDGEAEVVTKRVHDLMGDADKARVTVTPIRTEKVERPVQWCVAHEALAGSCWVSDAAKCEFISATVSYEVEVEG